MKYMFRNIRIISFVLLTLRCLCQLCMMTTGGVMRSNVTVGSCLSWIPLDTMADHANTHYANNAF